MAASSKILIFGKPDDSTKSLIEQLDQKSEVIAKETLEEALHELQDQEFSGVFLLDPNAESIETLLEMGGVLQQFPDGVVLLDPDLKILWSNSRFRELAGYDKSLTGRCFYDAFGTPEILGPDYCPFHTAFGSGQEAKSTLRIGEKLYIEAHAKPVLDSENQIPKHLVVIVRDISIEVLQRQKLNAIYQAGLELGDLSPQEVLEMSVDDRIELLKSKILHYTRDLLEFDTVEIRLLDKRTKQLDPLLAVGMEPVAADRTLYAEPNGNGVTGFVGATGKSYLCEDIANDPLYISGAPGARSSLTVPLILHDEILGTFNVESPRIEAFDENDLQFLELFCREVAVA